ncbi:hypothetical protein FRC06_010254 [Ceratobasidium sp. 370]|nr:hypothetical protein FRC06_010254 [Ceratobasidium sp. 370]
MFGFVNPGSDENIVDANRRLFARIHPNTFHCRYLDNPDNFQYEHPAFIRAMCEAFYWHSDSFAVRDPKRFEIMPLPAVAFVLTMMQECIEEWQTGRCKSRELNFKTQRSIFDAHLQGLIEYRKSASRRLYRFQKKWFKTGMEYAGVIIHESEDQEEYCQPITRACNVRPDTPEPSYYEDGRFTAKSKGKGREIDDSDDD